MRDQVKQREIRDYYDKSDYFESFKDHFGTRDSRFNLYARKYIFSIYYPKKHDRIVDLGCGWGNISLTLARAGFDVYGVDYSVKSVELCRRGAVELKLDPHRFICADVSNLPFDHESFDVVYTAGLVEHLYAGVFAGFLNETRRILRPGGILVIGTPNPHHFLELMKRRNIFLKAHVSHVDYKTMPRLRRALVEHGFSLERAYFYPSHLPLLSLVEKTAQRFVPFLRRRICIRAVRVEGGDRHSA